MKKFLLAFTFMVASVFTVNAQTVDEVRLQAGATHIGESATFTGNVELRKAINSRFEFDNTASLTTDGDTNLFQNQSLLRAYVTDNIFVAGGLNVGKLSNRDAFLNPSFRAGLNFDIDRVNIEPYAELNTPDLLSSNDARSLAIAGIVKVRVNDSFGLLGNGGVRSTRVDNQFFDGRVETFATGGVYFKF